MRKDHITEHTVLEEIDWLKHICVTNNRVYRIDTMRDITTQKRIMINGYEYNLRKVVFFVIHGRWPSHQFLLPWE